MKTPAIATLICAIAIIAGCYASDRVAPPELNHKTILVTGATGTQGGAVARELIKRGYSVRGLTRNPDSDRARAMSDLGAEMVRGDFSDAESLAAAMSGVYGVFAVTDFWEHGYRAEVDHGKQLVDSALAAGVDHFVFTSVDGADSYTGVPHFESKGEIEVYLEESGLNYSIVRPVSFMDNVKYDRQNIMSGVYFDPRDSDKTHQWIAASDIGFFVGEAFDHPDEWQGLALDIAGDELSIAEFTDLLSRSVSLDVHHQQITWKAYEQEAGEELTLMTRWFDSKGYDADVEGLRKKYPNLLTYQQYLQNLDWDQPPR